MRKTDSVANKQSVFSMLGAGTHSNYERVEHDFYSTDPSAIDYLLQHETFDENIWECACGNGNLSKQLEKYGYNVYSTDLVYRGYGEKKSVDFIKQRKSFDGDIITNPPYTLQEDFILNALQLSKRKVAMFLKIQFLESKKRYLKIFRNYPPTRIYVFVKRIWCYRNDDRTNKNSAVCYSWFVWDKENIGETKVYWIENF